MFHWLFKQPRGTTANDSKEVLEPTVEVIEEMDRMVVLLEISGTTDGRAVGGSGGGAGETDGTNELTEIEDDGCETDRMNAPSEVVEAGGETDRLDALSEILRAGGEADRMDVLSEVQQPGGTGEADGRDELSEVVKAGGETDPVDALLDALSVVGDAGDDGEADWTEAHLEQIERICGQCPRIQAEAECCCVWPSCAGKWLECF